MRDRKTVACKKKDGLTETFKTVALLLSLSPFFAFFSFSIWKYLFHWFIYFYCRKQFTLKVVGNSFPNSDRLISHHTKQISLPYPFLPPIPAKKCQTGFLDFIRMFIAIVMPHSLFQISIFWSKLEWESLDCEGRKLGLRVLNVHVAGRSLKKLFSAFLRTWIQEEKLF